MTTKPILFNAEMIKAFLAGRKTETRRLIKAGNHKVLGGQTYFNGVKEMYAAATQSGGVVVAPFQKGDILWVRETWAFWPCVTCGERNYCAEKPASMETADGETEGCFLYRADGETPIFRSGQIWRPSIHMPRQAARIFLRVEDVRAERLWSIEEADAKAEGVFKGWKPTGASTPAASARQAFMWLWQQCTRKGPEEQDWAANPWVWVIRFEPCERPGIKNLGGYNESN